MQTRSLPPNPLWFALEGPRAFSEALGLPFAAPILAQAPRGDGHPVLVLPGFAADDGSTRLLREFLHRLGYSVHRWAMGRNMGLDGRGTERLQQRLAGIFERKGRKLSLIGWSLGGIYARELAKAHPDSVRQVITLGSPFGAREQRSPPPPVPSTAIFSKTDGIASWRSCIEVADEGAGQQVDNIEVPGSHCGLGFNALVYWAVADRLALPESGWRPFERRGLRRLFYR